MRGKGHDGKLHLLFIAFLAYLLFHLPYHMIYDSTHSRMGQSI
jgi:hypothetical protein